MDGDAKRRRLVGLRARIVVMFSLAGLTLTAVLSLLTYHLARQFLLEPAPTERDGARREDRAARGVRGVEAELHLAFDRGGRPHTLPIIVRSAATSHARASGA